ncbi:uncharacterized protein LOC144683625 [Cetorhinus maximus]
MAAKSLFERQTEYLLKLLLEEEDGPAIGFRCLEEPVEDSDAIRSLGFHLRELGDLIDKEHLDSFTKDFQKIAAQHATDKACELFLNTVNEISQERANGDLAVEQNLLRITVSLGKQVAKKTPSLVEQIKKAMEFVFNTKLQSWMTAAGGWASIHIE